MQVMYPRCAALDLGKDVLAAAIRVQDEQGSSRSAGRTGRPVGGWASYAAGCTATASRTW
jgi:hypothetical protein